MQRTRGRALERGARRDIGPEDGLPSYVLVLGAIAFAVVMIATVGGPGLDPDSVRYLSSGINLARGRGLVDLTGAPLTVFAPGVSLIVALGESIGIPAEQVVRCVNATCAAVIVVLGHLLIRRARVRSGVLAGATVLLAVSPTVLSISKMANSEALFVVVTLAFLLLLDAVWTSRRLTIGNLAALLLLVWCAFLLRYAGGCLVAVGTGVLAWRVRPIDRRWLAWVSSFVVLSASVPVAWLLRNHRTDGTWLGPRVPSPDRPADVLERLASTSGRWILGGGPGGPLAVTLGAIVVVGVAAILIRVDRRPKGAPHGFPSVIGVVALFIGVYVAYMSYAQLTTGIDPLDIRLLAPVYVPFLVLVARAIDEILTWCTRAGQPGVTTRMAMIGMVVVVLQAGFSLRSTVAEVSDGIGFNGHASLDSELAATTAASVPADAVLLSNSIEDLWAATGRQPLRPAPAFAGIRGVPLHGEAQLLARDVTCSTEPVFAAMYLDGDPKALTAERLREVVRLETVAEANDGILYRVVPIDPDGPVAC